MQLPKQGLNLHRGNPINLDILDKLTKAKTININTPDKEVSFYSTLGRIARLKHHFPNRQHSNSTWDIILIRVKHPNQDFLVNNPNAPFFHINMLKYGVIPRNIVLEITAHYKTSETIQRLSNSGQSETTTVNINDFESFIVSIGPDGYYDHTSKKFNVVVFYFSKDITDGANYYEFRLNHKEINNPEIGILVLPKIMFIDLDFKITDRLNIIDYLYKQALSKGLKIIDVKAITSKNIISISNVAYSKIYGSLSDQYALFGSNEFFVLTSRLLSSRLDGTAHLYVLEYVRKFFKTNKPFELRIYIKENISIERILFFAKNPLLMNNFT